MQLIGLALKASIFLAVLGVGMRLAPGDLSYVLSRRSRLLRSLLAMNVVAPAVAILVGRLFALHPAVLVALVTLAVAPVGPRFSQAMLPLVAPEHAAYARGHLFASAVLSVVLTPLAVEVIRAINGGDVHVNPLSVARVVISSVLLPLAVGLVMGRKWPATRRWIPAMDQVSSLVLLACIVAILAVAWSYMGLVIRQGTLIAIVIITFVGLIVGHVLGGPDGDGRTVLAFATVSRHPGVALVVASLTDQQLAPIGVLLALLVSEIAVVPYKLWRKRLHAAPAARPTTGAH